MPVADIISYENGKVMQRCMQLRRPEQVERRTGWVDEMKPNTHQ